jgi:predicted Fe-Mo cluster-binding NifX family protein
MIDNQDIQYFKDYGMNVYTKEEGTYEFLILENNNKELPISDEFIGVIQERGYTVSWVNFEKRQIAFTKE